MAIRTVLVALLFSACTSTEPELDPLNPLTPTICVDDSDIDCTELPELQPRPAICFGTGGDVDCTQRDATTRPPCSNPSELRCLDCRFDLDCASDEHCAIDVCVADPLVEPVTLEPDSALMAPLGRRP